MLRSGLKRRSAREGLSAKQSQRQRSTGMRDNAHRGFAGYANAPLAYRDRDGAQKSKADLERLNGVLATLVTVHSALGISTDPQSGQRILSAGSDTISRRYQHRQAAGRLPREDHAAGDGRLHLYKADPRFRPTSRVKIAVEPLPPGGGFVFEKQIVDGIVPKEYLPGVEKGLESVLGSGVVVGLAVECHFGSLIADLRRRQNLQVRFLVPLRPDEQRRRCGANAQKLRRVARAYGRRR
jgi:hypothetical protein